MPNVTWDKFHPYVQPVVQGCPLGLINHAIRKATIEFCERTNLWKMGSPGADILKDQAFYTFDTPVGTRVTQPDWITINGKQLVGTTPIELDIEIPDWREKEQEYPHLYYVERPNTVRIIGIPTEDKLGLLDAQVSLSPTRDAVDCPDWLYENWVDVIASGALATLTAMAGKQWSDSTMAAYHNQIFRAGISRARSKQWKARQGMSLNIKAQPFGG